MGNQRAINKLIEGIKIEHDERVRSYIYPKRVVWKSGRIKSEQILLEKRGGQITLESSSPCVMVNKEDKASVLLDFGIELQGGIQILAWGCGKKETAKLRVRFGESAMEAMSEVGESGATNHHAIRDGSCEISFMGMTEIGNTGFRFVRVDLLGEDSLIEIKCIRAVFVYNDLEYRGSFKCNDELLNQIWKTAAYTVHLNMQEYLWDGIKRDRLVWIGDMHPEVSAIRALFGHHPVVEKSLDLVRDETPIPGWMNGIPTYSMWWILIHYDWYMQNGNLEYLNNNKSYLLSLLKELQTQVDEKGKSTVQGIRFLDWPSSGDEKSIEAGIQALHILALQKGSRICKVLGELQCWQKCKETEGKLREFIINKEINKQAAGLMVLAQGLDPLTTYEEIIGINGAKGLSTFLGYYTLEAMAIANKIDEGIDVIKEYWGGMIKLGATTFWEDFDIDWLENAGRIDELVGQDKVDVHGEYGEHCYKGYRHSLCHGWASGPVPWLAKNVLGVQVMEPGCKAIKIAPHLGKLEWVEGSYPTPFGDIKINHRRNKDGKITSDISVPNGVHIIKTHNYTKITPSL